jgi:DNA-binding LacI/PurR family transcriptional regulator
MKKKVTMQTIADAVGVGKVTVSRAFRSDPKCGAVLREKILTKAKELGYTPDPIQRVHMAQVRSGQPVNAAGTVIAFLDMHMGDYRLENCPSNSRLVVGARARANELGLQLQIFRPVEAKLSLERFYRILKARGIHGILVGPMPGAHSQMDLNFSGLAAVAFSYSLERPNLHRVGHNHFVTLRNVLEALYQKGVRRFGLALQSSMDHRVGQRWHASFFEFGRVHTDVLISVHEPELNQEATQANSGVRQKIDKWIRSDRPEVILGISSWLPGVLRKLGVDDEIRYLDLDLYPGKFPCPVAGVDQRYEALGATAVNEVVGQWSRQEYGIPHQPKTILLDGHLVTLEGS